MVANASLVKREGSAAFTAAVSHILAWAMLLVAATGEPRLKSKRSMLAKCRHAMRKVIRNSQRGATATALR